MVNSFRSLEKRKGEKKENYPISKMESRALLYILSEILPVPSSRVGYIPYNEGEPSRAYGRFISSRST